MPGKVYDNLVRKEVAKCVKLNESLANFNSCNVQLQTLRVMVSDPNDQLDQMIKHQLLSIEILIGADVAGELLTGYHKLLSCELVSI